MKIRPLGSKVLVRRDDAPDTTEGGIIIPDTSNEKPLEGEVVAVGDGAILQNGTKVAMTVKKGDIVFFGPYSGTEITLEGKDHVIIDENEIIAIVEK
jgi:chaperonin GroES